MCSVTKIMKCISNDVVIHIQWENLNYELNFNNLEQTIPLSLDYDPLTQLLIRFI